MRDWSSRNRGRDQLQWYDYVVIVILLVAIALGGYVLLFYRGIRPLAAPLGLAREILSAPPDRGGPTYYLKHPVAVCSSLRTSTTRGAARSPVKVVWTR